MRYGNINNFVEAPLVTTVSSPLVMSMTGNGGNNHIYRFFITDCGMTWCYSEAVGQTDTRTSASYQLEAGQWEITATMDVQNLILVSL